MSRNFGAFAAYAVVLARAAQIADATAERVAVSDPAMAEQLRATARRLDAKIDALEREGT